MDEIEKRKTGKNVEAELFFLLCILFGMRCLVDLQATRTDANNEAGIDERGVMRQSSGGGRGGQSEGRTEEGLVFNS